MGEVYRAHDTKLGRDVAVKVLPARLSGSADALARLEREARAVAALSHPNILAIHDFGSADGVSYAVMELLEGESLRAALAAGPLPARRATDYAIQIARGLAAAHDKGIVHRDLKPENVFVTRDDRVKILDFGLARVDPTGGAVGTLAPTVNSPTEPGVVLGTVGYMAPEQVRGDAADWRADLFSFGAVLYEMLTGMRPFVRETAAETMTAILREDPPEPSKPLPAALDRIIRHCLEKKPEARFRSAHDLAFALETAAGASTIASRATTPVAARRVPVRLSAAITAVSIAAAAAGGFLTGRFSTGQAKSSSTPPQFRQLTFDRGIVTGARFAPDGRTVVYSATWNGAASRLFLARLEFPGATPIATGQAVLYGVSANAELASGLNPVFENPNTAAEASLVRMPLLGGAAQPVLDHVKYADWNPSGTELAVVRVVGAQQRLEYPVGTMLYETTGEIGNPRVSPDGRSVAFLDWPVRNDDRGTVRVVDRDRKFRTLSRTWEAVRNVAWRPDGQEVWYSAASAGTIYDIWGSRSRPADERLVLAAPGGLLLHDINKDGKALLARFDRSTHVEGSFDGSPTIDFSWLDFSFAWDISRDKRRILLTYSGQGSSPSYDVYVRGVQDAEATRIGEGQAQQFSPDGRSVLAVVHGPPSRLVILPTGGGDARVVPTGTVTVMHARWVSGQRLLLVGSEPNHGIRAYVMDLATSGAGAPRPITPERITFRDQIALAPDGARVAFRSPDDEVMIYATDGSGSVAARGFSPNEMPVGWTGDAHSLLIIAADRRSIVAIEPSSGKRAVLKTLVPSDAALFGPTEVMQSPDGRSYVANYGRRLDTLFVVDGLR
jgi:Tol biopolymer transport system component